MKRSVISLEGYTMKATNGEIGKVNEFYFDDKTWTVRYLIVKTGSWLFGREVLISPEALQQPNWGTKEFPVNLTTDQVKGSPDIDTDKPVSRQQEELLYEHYPWQGYWGSGFYAGGTWGVMPAAPVFDESAEATAQAVLELNGDMHLRSTERLTGYSIHATDGEIGEIVDFIVDDTTWKIEFLVVHTGGWLNSKKLLLATKWIKAVNWQNSVVIVNISLDGVKSSPGYNPDQPLNKVYEDNLYDYHGRLHQE